MDTYHTDGTPIEKYPEKTNGDAVPSFKRETATGESPFHPGRGPGRGEDKPSRRFAQDSPDHK